MTSTAPGITSCGIPTAPAASSRVGPAVQMPPLSSSVTSLVVQSRTPAKTPRRTRSSIVAPPLPLAWKTTTSQPASSKNLRTCVPPAVVTPNIVIAMSGLFCARLGAGDSAMPHTALAALARMGTSSLFKPAMSATLGMTMMSVVASRPVSVETISFGNPMGSWRMIAVPIQVPVPPPIAITACTSARSTALFTRTAAPDAITSIARARCNCSTALAVVAAALAIASRDASAASVAPGRRLRSTTHGACPRARMVSATNRASSDFVSSVASSAIRLIL